jgi:hypothetical protein
MKAIRSIGRRFVAAGAILLTAGVAQATLVDRGGGMIYDTELNITWLQNWNQAKGSGYDVGPPEGSEQNNGAMSWTNALLWADRLVWGGYSDWRLPTMIDSGEPGCTPTANGPDCGENVLTKVGNTVYSEMAHLWYVTLGNKSFNDPVTGIAPQPGWGLVNSGPFKNIQLFDYWSGLVYPVLNPPDPFGTDAAFFFNTENGYQGRTGQINRSFAVAVRNGDVAGGPGIAPPLPEPQSLVLVALALGMAALARRQAKR